MNKHSTEMLQRLVNAGISLDDAQSLRRISMTLHRWHEMECNGEIEREEKWAVERAAWPAADRARWWDGSKWNRKAARRTYSQCERETLDRNNPFPIDFAWRETGEKVYGRSSHHDGRWPVNDRETGARKRLAKIMARYPGLSAYVQTDPRGCALYVIRPGDVPEGADVSAYYSRGLAVYK